MKKRIAIVGTGISGLTCAYMLHKDHDITVFEANDYIGGHTATKDISIDDIHYAIDTGFIVFNDWTYPYFNQLMSQIGVNAQPTEMSFSVTNQNSGLVYNGNSIATLFAQKRNLFNPKFWGLIRSILRFNKRCKALNKADNIDADKTVGEFLKEENYFLSIL